MSGKAFKPAEKEVVFHTKKIYSSSSIKSLLLRLIHTVPVL
jgi:hypothetical protein